MAANLEYYKVFYYVAKYKNMTKAAAALMSNQPNVTRVMNLLEAELGCRLIIRSNRGITLTTEGQQLYAHVAAAFEQLQMGEEELEQTLKLEKGAVYIGTSETALHVYMLEQLGVFHRKYPDIRLKIFNFTTPEALAALKNRQIDFAVVTTPVDGGANFREVMLKPYQVILAGGSQFAHLAEKGVCLKDLTKYPFISLAQSTKTFECYRRLFWEHGLVYEPDIEVATTDLIMPMIVNNLGIGFLPYAFAEEAIRKGEAVEISVKEGIPDRNICLVTENQRTLSVAAMEFIKMMKVTGRTCLNCYKDT